MNMTWRELFREGRFIFYEGDDPEGFAKEINERFGFDPRQSEDFNEHGGYGFHCPPEHLDDIYGTDKYPMGS